VISPYIRHRFKS